MSVERTREVMDRYWDSGHRDLGRITRGRVYMETPVMLRQLGRESGAAAGRA